MKKNIFKVLALTLVSVMLLMVFASCSAYGKIEKNFTDAGYELVSEDNSTANTIKAELEEGEVGVTVHIFKKSDSILNYAIVLEFSSEGDVEKSLEKSATLKGFVEDVQKSDLVRDNCVLIPIGIDAANMTEIFNK